MLRAARLACFLGLEVGGGKLLLEIFELHGSFASGLCLMAVHSSQGAGWVGQEPLGCVLLPSVLHLDLVLLVTKHRGVWVGRVLLPLITLGWFEGSL